MNPKQIVSLVLISILVINLVLFALKKINELAFWVIILLGGVSTYILNKKWKQ